MPKAERRMLDTDDPRAWHLLKGSDPAYARNRRKGATTVRQTTDQTPDTEQDTPEKNVRDNTRLK